MKFIKISCLLFLLIFSGINSINGQKKNIDSNAYPIWSSIAIGGTAITHNGKFVYNMIENEPTGHKTFVFQSTENTWKRSFKDVSTTCFLNTKKDDYAIILDQKDHLLILSLGKEDIQTINGVSSFSTYPNGESEWIAYSLKSYEKELILQNINTGKKNTYMDVTGHILADDGQTLILQTEKKTSGGSVQELYWINLSTGKNERIWAGSKVKNIVLDIKHHQLAFICEDGLFSYDSNTHRLNCLMNNQNTYLNQGLKLEKINRFSYDGESLFIELKEEEKPEPKPATGLVEVWSYLDRKLQSEEVDKTVRTYATVVNLNNGKVVRLEHEFEKFSLNLSVDGASDTIGLITRRAKDNGAFYMKNSDSYDLIFIKSGKRTPLKYQSTGLSPSGRYLVYLDYEQHAYFSYNTKTGIYQNISKEVSEILLEPNLTRPKIAGWLEHDEGVLFYDDYDIWKLDLSGQKTPVSLTNGYGKKNHLVFSIVYGQYLTYPLNKSQKLMLAAFNLQSKQQGFYSLDLGKLEDPRLLTMGDYYYGFQSGVLMTIDGGGGSIPIKAKKADIYLVARTSAKESTNYFSTKDFKTFKPLSNVHPERDYNWYKTELHTWTSLDGTTLQGVLYKPENFDPHKKYPVIFHYYESKSNNLNVYIKPQILCNNCTIDIPTYVSNGYLVFTPDIIYKIGDPMQGTYDAVVSAAKHIGALPFVDAKKMGIQGCSWGGIQTDYLVTHTNLFAAACSSSGIADWVSGYGKLYPNGVSKEGIFENGQCRMGGSIWEIPNAYIKNSSILNLGKVTTPFLIMHTKDDGVCPYEDAIELFIGLRRLGKKSWMLTYPGEDHGISDEKKAKDFSLRMMQFFDHYLKDKPAPVWMTRGIPAERRGLDNGYEYDTKIKTPGPGPLAPEEQKKVDSIMARKPILIELK